MYLYHITYFHFKSHCRHYNKQRCNNFKYSDVLPPSWFLSQPVHHPVRESEHMSWWFRYTIEQCESCKSCNLNSYLSPPTRLPPIAGSQLLARAIVGLFYLYNTTYIIDLNWIIYRSSPGFEPGSLGPKAATLPLCYTPLTCLFFLSFFLPSF